MLWIKRNLFWAAFGLATLALLGAGGFYLLTGIQKNSEADNKLEELKQRWQRLQALNPYPNATNITLAREGAQQLREFIASAKKHFVPVPFQPVSGTEFKRVLDVTIADLQNKARQYGVQLPTTNYAFSFDAQRNKVQFAAGSMPLLPELLAEVTTVCSRLFEAKVNKIVDLKRPITSDDPGQAMGCHRLPRDVNPDLGFVMSPYEVTFLTFSSELADTLESFSRATNCFLVKAIGAEASPPGVGGVGSDGLPIDPATGLAGLPPNPTQPPPPGGGGRPIRGVRGLPPAGGRTVKPASGPGAAAGEALRTVLNERLFKVTCLVMLVKPSIKPSK
jgi:hypothetical protein